MDTPELTKVSIIMGKTQAYGTGRVKSQILITTCCLPVASNLSGNPASGFARESRMALASSATGTTVSIVRTSTGTSLGRVILAWCVPYLTVKLVIVDLEYHTHRHSQSYLNGRCTLNTVKHRFWSPPTSVSSYILTHVVHSEDAITAHSHPRRYNMLQRYGVHQTQAQAEGMPVYSLAFAQRNRLF